MRLGMVVLSAAASVATFANPDGWSMHKQLENAEGQNVKLTSSAPTFTDVFLAAGSGTGTKELNFDAAVELRMDAEPTAPIAVRLRFVPTGASLPTQEAIRYVTSRETFVAVHYSVACQSSVLCSNEGTVEVTPVTPSELGAGTLDVHWVVTASLFGRGPAAPADAILNLTQP